MVAREGRTKGGGKGRGERGKERERELSNLLDCNSLWSPMWLLELSHAAFQGLSQHEVRVMSQSQDLNPVIVCDVDTVTTRSNVYFSMYYSIGINTES